VCFQESVHPFELDQRTGVHEVGTGCRNELWTRSVAVEPHHVIRYQAVDDSHTLMVTPPCNVSARATGCDTAIHSFTCECLRLANCKPTLSGTPFIPYDA
jgi:hypothetical protein